MGGSTNADDIADCVLNAFDALPTHRKPRQASTELKPGRREWVPLAGIVIDSGSDEPPAKRLKCAALATGMKCLPQDKIATLQGNVIHDSHAEILALRAFNRFLLEQCADLAAKSTNPAQSDSQSTSHHLLEWTPQQDPHAAETPQHDRPPLWQGQPFRIKPAVTIHMYCSEAPCGDASMELTMAQQEDATPWSRGSTPALTQTDPSQSTTALESAADLPAASNEEILYGRSYFDVLGVVRRKPSRPDAPPTLSKSCSDKLALKQCTSTLSSITSLLIHPANAYIQTLTLPSSQYVHKACQRAFAPEGRMAPLVQHPWSPDLSGAGYHYQPFQIRTTTREFTFSRRIPAAVETASFVPSNLSSLTYGQAQETLINGVLQGRKQADPRGASAVSRRKMWSLALQIAASVGHRALIHALSHVTHSDLKTASLLKSRELVKKVARQGPLRGWKRNSGDDTWSL